MDQQLPNQQQPAQQVQNPNPQQQQAQQQQAQQQQPTNDQPKEGKGDGKTGEVKKLISIEKLLNSIITAALDQRASDIHIEPEPKRVRVRLRIDGILRESWSIQKEYEQSLIFKIKIAGKLRTDEHFAPQDGRISFKLDEGKKVDTRVSILPTTHGEKVVFRLLTQDGRSFELKDLGLVGQDFEMVQRAYQKPYGTILTVGPTGSGKTTTLYAILKLLNSPEVNITTVEDPVEYNIVGVNHIQINTKADLTFASGLRSILRQDPDIVMVGEIRDGETARIATNAAMTGHLVLSTLHTNDSVTTIPRLIDMGIEPFLVASTVNLVIAQRLARKLCETCRQPYVVTEQDLTAINRVRPDIGRYLKVGEQLFREKGCANCTDGFQGRIGLYETLQITKDIRDAITDNANADKIFEIARKEGLVLIVEDGINKLRAGVTSISEVNRVTALKV
ncbi:type II/IV secretion system protein [Candidatus Dojkabacteria bacterium]|uniref:Type II/IV secretion system protein n=1 Tax=Candidatus Dojkabacteria bacterium TaxID=2099670 RepID=A0A955L885_9BACT|nr:type II/IV secretion system protein [Candidatus Dojkabacteria bacterium]